jgi:hypothetical protein
MKIYIADSFKYLIFFNILYTFILVFFKPDGISPLKLIVLLNLILSIFFMFCINYRNFSRLFYIVSLYDKITFLLLLTWLIIMVLRSLSFDLNNLITIFGHPTMMWAWLCMLCIPVGANIRIFITSLPFIYNILLFLMAVLLLFINFIPSQQLAAFTKIFMLFPILLLCSGYFPLRKKIVIYAFSFLYLLLAVLSDNRMGVLYFLYFWCCLFIFSVVDKNAPYKRKLLVLTILIFAIVLFAMFLDDIYLMIASDEVYGTDTRTFLFIELFNDLTGVEQLFGKGVFGSYYSDYFYSLSKYSDEGDHYQRIGIEVGYLQMILKGGWVLIVLNIAFLLPISIKAIFKSNNILVVSCGFYIFGYLLFWLISYHQEFTPAYVLLWGCVGVAISKKNKLLTNDDILRLLKNK